MSIPISVTVRPHRVAVLEPDLRVRNALFRLLDAARYDATDWSLSEPVASARWHDVAIVDPTAPAAAALLSESGDASAPPIILLVQHPELVSAATAGRAAVLLSKACEPQDLLNALDDALVASVTSSRTTRKVPS